ncbi:MAG TPA: MBOAT family O-acyltransferase, partial [Chitinophagaceae bacterium]|nr:MBOAT family O-acyltransferase [Chitinophagaceae bacterium]
AMMLVLHNLPLSWKAKKTNLLLASYLFYAAWNPPFILLLWLSTVIDFFVGKALYAQQNPYKKKLLLVVSLIGNLGMLCFFKYGTFLLDNFVQLTSAIGLDFHPAKPNIILPAGISFYTFTTLCYTIDMYKKRSEPVKSLLDFSLFVTFFPHLVAGPIVRPEQLVPQFETPRRATQTQLLKGLFLLSLGLFMKVVLADGMLAAPVDAVFGSAAPVATLDAWMGVLAFSGQIFFDFAGYSTCAVAVAMCLGFVLPENFKYPYAATGFSDFWKRWHITLSTWLRDYLYIPLGGNRHGKYRTYLNLMITMLLGGLWHGANWTFVVWGGLHGLFLAAEKMIQDFSRKRVPVAVRERELVVQGLSGAQVFKAISSSKLLLALLTFFLVNVTWVFFRSPDFVTAWRILTSMFTDVKGGAELLPTLSMIKIAVIISLMLVCHWLMRDRKVLSVTSRLHWWALGLAWAVMLILLILSQESTNSFIYFQF